MVKGETKTSHLILINIIPLVNKLDYIKRGSILRVAIFLFYLSRFLLTIFPVSMSIFLDQEMIASIRNQEINHKSSSDHSCLIYQEMFFATYQDLGYFIQTGKSSLNITCKVMIV